MIEFLSHHFKVREDHWAYQEKIRLMGLFGGHLGVVAFQWGWQLLSCWTNSKKRRKVGSVYSNFAVFSEILTIFDEKIDFQDYQWEHTLGAKWENLAKFAIFGKTLTAFKKKMAFRIWRNFQEIPNRSKDTWFNNQSIERSLKNTI